MRPLVLFVAGVLCLSQRSAAQITMAATARAELLGFSPLSDPTAWSLGMALALERPLWQAQLEMRGSPEKLGGWGAELSALARGTRPWSPTVAGFMDVAAAAGRPARLGWSHETIARLGIEKRLGRFALRLAGAGMVLGLPETEARLTPGLMLEGAYHRSNLRLSAQLGHFRRIRARTGEGLGDWIDTLQPKTYFTRLAHSRVDARWTHRWLEISGAVVRRSLPIRLNPIGYELGLGIAALPGAKFHLVGGRMPISGSNYLVAGNKLSFGVELSRRPRADRPAAGAVEPRRSSFEIEPSGDGRFIIRIWREGVQRVEILGDFSDWDPIALERDRAGFWRTTLRLTAGAHLICVRFDGGSLEVPEGLTAVADDFGGSAGLLMIPESDVAATQ